MSLQILKKEILPLFEILDCSDGNQTNNLISTGLNRYSLYVDLEDVYQRKSQRHQIESSGQNWLEYNIPLHYHEIVMRGKGIYYEDVRINIYSLRHEKYIRVNDSDLLYFQNVDHDTWTQSEYKITKLDGEEHEIKLDPEQHFYFQVEEELGLPMPKSDIKRGKLYIVLIRGNQSNQPYQNMLLEILNYHNNSNVTLDKN